MTVPDQTITIKLVVLPSETETTPEVTPGHIDDEATLLMRTLAGRIDALEGNSVSKDTLRALFLAAKRNEINPTKDDVRVAITFDHLGYVKGWSRI